MERMYIKYLGTPQQKINYYDKTQKEAKKSKNKRLRNRTPKQKERARLKRLKIREYQKQRTKRRNLARKKHAKEIRNLKCKLKKGQTSKKLPAKDGRYGAANGYYCHNCTPENYMNARKKYCETKGGTYNHSCVSCIYK